MEELHCKGTPAQVARRVLAVLGEDPDLLWLIDQYKNYPRPLPKALNELDGRRVPNELENWPVLTIHLFGKLSHTGDIPAEPPPQYVLLTADARVLKIWHDGQQQRHQITEDFSELAPIWEKVKAELNRRGMVIEAEPAQAKRNEQRRIPARLPIGTGATRRPGHGTMKLTDFFATASAIPLRCGRSGAACRQVGLTLQRSPSLAGFILWFRSCRSWQR